MLAFRFMEKENGQAQPQLYGTTDLSARITLPSRSFILDIFKQEDKEPRPEVLHGDTQAQSLTIFGMAYLLGIELMPRIRNWKDLKLCRPSHDITSTHINELFSDTVDWDLIEMSLTRFRRVSRGWS